MQLNSYKSILSEIGDVKLVVVSKTRTVSQIQLLYNAGHRDFGENRVQEWEEKVAILPDDIRWHLIGHIQTNKVKQLSPTPYLIHSGDRIKLLKALDQHGERNSLKYNVLIQIKIAEEESKYGFDWNDLLHYCREGRLQAFSHIRFCGVMGMATLTDNADKVRSEFRLLQQYFTQLQPFFHDHPFDEISMGMSGDYDVAIAEGATMIRIGSKVFD
jgi:PLP dependent protein